MLPSEDHRHHPAHARHCQIFAAAGARPPTRGGSRALPSVGVLRRLHGQLARCCPSRAPLTPRRPAGGILFGMPVSRRAQPVDCLVSGTVITCDGARTVLFDGAVAVRGSQIVAVGERQDLESRFVPDGRLGGRRAFVLPGFIDCHSHLAQALVRSLIAHELPMIYRLYLPAEDAMTLEQCGHLGPAVYGPTDPLGCDDRGRDDSHPRARGRHRGRGRRDRHEGGHG